ncbi:MAG: alanine racemase [Candidatus Hydrogenedentota bacterium]|mgnify:CR=1 FL=1
MTQPFSSDFLRAKLERPTWVEIDSEAIRSNIASLRRRLPASTRFMAVVKAEAYGHGAIGVAHAAESAGAAMLGVATPYEGQLLRAAGIELPIVILSPVLPQQAASVAENRLTPCITSLETARALSGTGTQVHVKVNTGMNRAGIEPDETIEFLRAVRAIEGVEVEGVFSHFAGSDDPDRTSAYDQFDRFELLLRELRAAELRPPIAHISNSGAIIDMPEMSLDMVRAGIAMYGLYPSLTVSRLVKLVPALSWKSHVIETRRLTAGARVSYSGTWVAPRETTVALMPVGYADGLRRALSSKGEVLVRGKRRRIAGRVCMDLTVIDCDSADVEPGDEIVLIGRQGDEVITAEDQAEWIGTNNYEVTTQITYRVPRRIQEIS